MLNIKTLEHESLEIIYNTFIKAFVDYEVSMNPSFSDFKQMLRRRSYDSKYSVGAYVNEELVGFILNGSGVFNDKKTLYDQGTGVIKEYRRQGITSQMFQFVKEIMQIHKIEQYLLEVLTVNEKAYELYLKEGFKVSRTLNCYRLDEELVNDSLLSLETSYAKNTEGLEIFNTCKPSWQNSFEAIMNVKDDYNIIHYYHENKWIAYAIIQKESGDIAQLAVKEEYRRQGVGSIIIKDLKNHTNSDTLSMINVDDEYNELNQFLKKHGFVKFVDQYEMVHLEE